MPQLSLYLDDATMEKLRRDAAREGKSLSKYVVGVLHNAESPNGWPPGWFERVYGCMEDDNGFELPEDSPAHPDEIKPLDYWFEHPEESPR